MLFRSAGWAKNWRLEPRLYGPAPERPLRDDLYATPQDLPEGERMQKWEGAPSEADVVFDDGAVLEFGPLRLRAIHTPGHTPGHCSFYHEASGVIFTGNHVLKRTTPNPGLYFIDNQYEKRTRSVPDYLRSLEKLRQFDCRLLLGAHEAPMDDLQAAPQRLIKHHEDRAVEALEALRRGRQTTFGVLPFLFPNLRRNGLFPAVGETLGHMDLLEDRGQAVTEAVDGRILYRAVA